MPDEPGADGEEGAPVSRLRAVIEAKDERITALAAALEASLEWERRLELRPAEVKRRLSMDSSERVTRAVLVSSTCPFYLPGAKATWSGEDRLVYTLARRAPWLLRLMFAKFTHDVRRHPTAVFSMMTKLGPADQQILGREDFRRAFAANVAEAFRQGSRGPAHDYTLEARPWGVPIGQIRVPVEIWHGEDDRLVSPQASRILAAAVPGATGAASAARTDQVSACRALLRQVASVVCSPVNASYEDR